jgi:predicted metal-dependent hydrolase
MFYDSPLGFRASLGLLHGSIYSVAGNALTDWPVMQALTRAANATAPRRVYVMEQRTKWGNCSAVRNLSFNWRLILAPDFVLRYLVTHEAVHLAVPDHSAKFWLTVQSLCPETERAKQWLSANGRKLAIGLDDICETIGQS